MAGVVVNLLPLMVGSALAPVWIIIVLLLLRGERGLVKAAAFVAGVGLLRLIQGILFGYVFNFAAASHSDEGKSLIVATLLTMLGLALLITGVRKWIKDVDPDEPPPKWMTTIGDWSPARSFGIGLGAMAIAAKMWAFTLSAIGVIASADTPPAQDVILYLIFMLGAMSLMLIALLYAAILPKQSAQALGSAQGWLERNNRTIVIVVSLVFGLYFLAKGLTGLLS